MPLEQVAGTDLRYHLIAFDKDGRERNDGGGLQSEKARSELSSERITDVFLFSHGWQSDLPSARNQYSNWIRTMADCTSDVKKISAATGGSFRPILIGVHWPSMPFGDESMGEAGSFAVSAGEKAATEPDAVVEAWIDSYSANIADTPAAREALRVIVSSAIEQAAPDRLPPDVAAACVTLNQESGLKSLGPGAEPGSDREPFDPEAVYANVLEEESVSFGDFALGGLLALPRTLSFWAMKARARHFGETGGHKLLTSLMKTAAKHVRFHLMGHSFGCVVVSSMLGGQGGSGELVRPVDTLILVQGAISHWSYCAEIPFLQGVPGYFHSIVRDERVVGPIITTQSEHDLAVGMWYPLAAGINQELYFGFKLPRYGAVGGFGLCGLDERTHFAKILVDGSDYDFQPRQIYNLESSDVISHKLGIFVGAHSDFHHPEIAHAVWSAVMPPAGSR
jgi:hypothetical protein